MHTGFSGGRSVVWYSHLSQNFPQFIVIHTVKGFGIVNKAEIDVFWNSLAFSMIQRMLAIWSLVHVKYVLPKFFLKCKGDSDTAGPSPPLREGVIASNQASSQCFFLCSPQNLLVMRKQGQDEAQGLSKQTPDTEASLENQLASLSCYSDRFSSVQFSHVWLLWSHGLQHARPPCPPQAPGVYSNLCPLSQWRHPHISSSAVPFSSCPQSFPASGYFPKGQSFVSGGQSIGVSASASSLPMNIQDRFLLGWTGLMSLQSKGLSRVFSNTTVQKHQFLSTQLSL